MRQQIVVNTREHSRRATRDDLDKLLVLYYSLKYILCPFAATVSWNFCTCDSKIICNYVRSIILRIFIDVIFH